jgi:hypothetical protein
MIINASAASDSGSASGGAIYVYVGATVTLINTTIADASAYSQMNVAHGGAMFIYNGGHATLRSATIVAASVRSAIEAKGGALFSYGRGTLTRTAVVGCSAISHLVSEGGGLYVGLGSVLLRHATVFDGNTATVGATIHPAGGSVHYAFPTPAGSRGCPTRDVVCSAAHATSAPPATRVEP